MIWSGRQHWCSNPTQQECLVLTAADARDRHVTQDRPPRAHRALAGMNSGRGKIPLYRGLAPYRRANAANAVDRYAMGGQVDPNLETRTAIGGAGFEQQPERSRRRLESTQ